MQQEIEVRFLGVDYDLLRQKLKAADAHREYPTRAMKRVILDYADQRLQKHPGIWGLIRLRDEGDRTMLAYKSISRSKTYDTHEIELEVSSYDKTIEFFEAIGFKVISEQHTRRESWRFGDCEVTLDDWPWIPPMLEIEGPDEASLRQAAEKLGQDWADHFLGNSVIAYRRTFPGMTEDESIRDIEKLTFEKMPQWLKDRQ